jgi:hypothetical protein
MDSIKPFTKNEAGAKGDEPHPNPIPASIDIEGDGELGE